MFLPPAMIWLYRVAYLPLFLISFPFYLKRMLKRGGYGEDIRHRFGRIGPPPARASGKKRVWIQAVSVGEVLAVAPVIRELAAGGEIEIVLTTTTSTGYRLARDLYAAETVTIGLFPFDFWPCSATAWRRIRPDLILLMESELWPEHLHQAESRGVPILLANARLSDRSFRRYQKAGALAALMVEPVDTILAATGQDRERFLQLGAGAEDVHLSGNLKFDVDLGAPLSPGEVDALRAEMGFAAAGAKRERPLVILGSSTWPGEEASLLLLFEDAQAAGVDCRLLLVPRHAERRDEVEALIGTQDLPFHFRSRGTQAPAETRIYVGDTTGELTVLTQVADLVFIGKSLPPNAGGQTPIEAAALGKPILLGPNMANFRELTRSLLQAGAAVEVASAAQLRSEGLELLRDHPRRTALADAAASWHRAHRGAAAKTVEVIRYYLEGDPPSG